MFRQLFATMNDMLEQIIEEYPKADLIKRQDLNKKLRMLKSMSESCIEEWIRLEEKMAKFLEKLPEIPPNPSNAAPPFPEYASDSFRKGQGYFQLLMYNDAIREFEKAVKEHPDFLLARLYLAMGYLRLGDDAEAYRHFRLITSLTDHAQMKAISYHAMGCIQAKNANLEQAKQYFKLAAMADPSSLEPALSDFCVNPEENAEPGGFLS